MKILIASHTYIVDLNREKLRKLAQLDPSIEVTVVVPKRWRPGGVQNKIIETQPVDEGNFRVVPLSNLSENNQGLLTFGLDLVQLLKTLKPHILQTEQGAKAFSHAELITLNKQLNLNAKNVFFTWWNLPYEVKFPISVLEGFNLKHSHGIISGNQDGADVLRDHGYDGPIKVMPQLGVDEQLFSPQEQPELRISLGIKPDEFVVGFVGRFVEEKGLLTLFNALKKITDYPWKWLLLGRGNLKQDLLNKASEVGLRDRLICVESVPHDQVYRYINLMDVLVLPSETTYKFKTLTAAGWKEQFGHVLIEAMSCKVPVIGSDSGEIPHVIDEAGLVFPEGNVDGLRNSLRQVMENQEFRQDLAQKGYERVMLHYTNTALAKEQCSFYEQLL
ncbi:MULTISPECIES: hormogonium polysaccharide biosynthesis glycosyltransferase HpsO [unclassified Roseofilum]|uniref:hormogonium polysaccharide biosynthesis glycosyltransferase HpsO n=1 Tax=unclassified Roseofilum TaxID=2620099 RepID=UPI000E9A8283|nr:MULTISPECIES: hormogonium polysaccharide biosynthesis glycosyltransferase HpsO [unclassified Roseofilum]MBP0010483.1 hormogonium polysaccharide biosynthesis glycosyltransferase HpsO [Roseofilum sp. Belize Diploria]MBP0035255.1 hormogonium polysaccharide biosynthesis glycosyltransferase HpsO [Roseofilum sp. Belize BBD 4]HBQ97209.1 glycosyltransferase family 4 protein [Cyanobacteria bacterium UBA11691]